MIPFLDLKRINAHHGAEIRIAINRVLDSGWYVLGQEVEAFEREFAAYCDVGHCIGVANGLDALSLILRAYGIGEGDEVIVPTLTFVATANAGTAIVQGTVAGEEHDRGCDVVGLDPGWSHEGHHETTEMIIATARRNDSLGTRGRWLIFAGLCTVSLALALGFAAFGAYLTLLKKVGPGPSGFVGVATPV